MISIISLFFDKIVLSYSFDFFFRTSSFSFDNIIEFLKFARKYDKNSIENAVDELTSQQEVRIMSGVRKDRPIKEIQNYADATNEQIISLLMDSNRI